MMVVDECEWTIIDDCLNLFDWWVFASQADDESVMMKFRDWHLNYIDKSLAHASPNVVTLQECASFQLSSEQSDPELFGPLWLETSC